MMKRSLGKAHLKRRNQEVGDNHFCRPAWRIFSCGASGAEANNGQTTNYPQNTTDEVPLANIYQNLSQLTKRNLAVRSCKNEPFSISSVSLALRCQLFEVNNSGQQRYVLSKEQLRVNQGSQEPQKMLWKALLLVSIKAKPLSQE